jgi:predicted RNase H-like nuclease
MSNVSLAGIDLAWKGKVNQSGLAFGRWDGKTLTLCELIRDHFEVQSLAKKLVSYPHLSGIAIDAPLIVNNPNGQRQCETEVSREYGARYASCHTSNKTLYPSADSVRLSNLLEQENFVHLGHAPAKWQIECYPHPALIEIFGLEIRHPYKKGSVAERREGQIQLAEMLQGLSISNVLPLAIPDELLHHFSKDYISLLRGDELKGNEDKLDAVVCLYVAGLFVLDPNDHVFGDQSGGYMYVPQRRCNVTEGCS